MSTCESAIFLHGVPARPTYLTLMTQKRRISTAGYTDVKAARSFFVSNVIPGEVNFTLNTKSSQNRGQKGLRRRARMKLKCCRGHMAQVASPPVPMRLMKKKSGRTIKTLRELDVRRGLENR